MKYRSRDGSALERAAAFLSSVRAAAASLAGRRKARRIHELDLVEKSSLFVSEWYLRTYPDVAEARVNPLHHYMDVGWLEGRDPGPEFSTSSYLKANRDVAMTGANPLLHFVEFGHREGRGSAAHRPMPKQFAPPSTEFGAAALCVSFPLPHEQPIRWSRGYQLRPGADRFSSGECVVGFARDQTVIANLESWFSRLKALSGYGKSASGAEPPQLLQSADRLLDAWYVNTEQLRTRWNSGDFPVIIRAFQHDPLRDGMLCLVGEGLAASPIDVVDLHLKSPFFPVLLVFSTPDGTVRGARMLAFPSLCRGGAHYSELLYSSVVAAETNEIDPVGTGGALATRLLRLIEMSVSPAIARIDVEIRGGDGRGQLFQPSFQLWLEKVFKISVSSIGPTTSRAAEFLAEAVAVPPSTNSRERGAALRMGYDMIPTIRVLTEPEMRGGASAAEVLVPFLVAGSDASQPAIAIEFPRQKLPMPHLLTGRTAGQWPRLIQDPGAALPECLPIAAIASPAHCDMSDATLFVPIANAARSADTRSAITWVIETRGWPEGGLAQAVLALSLQIGGHGDCLFFVGIPDALAESVARERIAGVTNCFDEMGMAVAAAQTPVLGFIGAGVLLHETCTAAVLASLLDNDLVATASCAVIAVDQSGASWHATVADGGSFVTPSGASLGRAERDAVTSFLWGSNYPVTIPCGHLWLARKSSVTDWLGGSRRQLANGVHICSSEVTVSYIGREVPSRTAAYVPAATDERATRVRALFG